ncbi:hypothetical protein Ahy_A08g038440 isoform H [Arachis hypogaea]|uniref:Uncharacterized protein n=1 Tax=Arachis hypogaea TaxID=3818 RepID=A0A445BTP5_ARAHY|nr:hypothetical protein Ahy_A08g038440 isoform H [Arachis hypogaea]
MAEKKKTLRNRSDNQMQEEGGRTTTLTVMKRRDRASKNKRRGSEGVKLLLEQKIERFLADQESLMAVAFDFYNSCIPLQPRY